MMQIMIMMTVMIMRQWRLWCNEDKLAWNRKKTQHSKNI